MKNDFSNFAYPKRGNCGLKTIGADAGESAAKVSGFSWSLRAGEKH